MEQVPVYVSVVFMITIFVTVGFFLFWGQIGSGFTRFKGLAFHRSCLADIPVLSGTDGLLRKHVRGAASHAHIRDRADTDVDRRAVGRGPTDVRFIIAVNGP